MAPRPHQRRPCQGSSRPGRTRTPTQCLRSRPRRRPLRASHRGIGRPLDRRTRTNLAGLREAITTSVTPRVSAKASRCARPCTPAPTISKGPAGCGARRREASAETAAVRRAVTVGPSSNSVRAPVARLVTITSPWIVGRPLPALAGLLAEAGASSAAELPKGDLWQTIGLTLAKVAAFITLMLVVGGRAFPRVLWLVARTGSRELFTLCVITAAVGVAYASAILFDVSFALGAFFAGMMMRESEFSHRAAEDSLPLRDAFSVLFFVSVGMLFDPQVLLDEPLKVLAVVVIILVGKTVAAVGLVLAFRYPLNTALTVGASLAQIGEFSFILAGLGLSLGLLSVEGQNLILAGALISIALNSLLFAAIGPAQTWARARSAWARKLDLRDDPLAALPMSTDRKLLSDQVVLVGHGRVGKHIADTLDRSRIHYVVADSNREVVEALRKRGKAAVTGDASDPIVLVQAHITKAAMLVVTIPDPVASRKMVDIARKLNPDIEAVLRSETEDGAALLRKEKIGAVFVAEQELAASMARHVAGRLIGSQ